MILCIDIGNSSIRCALGAKDDYTLAIADTCDIVDANSFVAFINNNFGNGSEQITGCILSSVVPQKNADILQAIRMLNADVIIKHVDITNYGVDFSGYKSTLGEDRAVCCVTATAKYGAPVIVIDYGTATTVNIVDENRVFLGGAILTGIQTGIDALARVTARLPQLDISENNNADIKLIGNDTNECLVSGAIIGAAYVIEGYVKRIKAQFSAQGAADPTVIVTGGYGSKVIPYCNFDLIFHQNLLIEGLFLLYENA